MSKKNKRYKDNSDHHDSYIDNITNVDLLLNNVVISSIQGLCHAAEIGDEKFLIPLLEHQDKMIVAATLLALCNTYGQSKKLKDRIIQFASEYPNDDEDYELQRTALFLLKEIAVDDDTMYHKLIEIAENYHDIIENSNAALMNSFAWELIAELSGQKIKGTEITELYCNTQSERSELIRNKIRNKTID
jgi:hypothetical protein